MKKTWDGAKNLLRLCSFTLDSIWSDLYRAPSCTVMSAVATGKYHGSPAIMGCCRRVQPTRCFARELLQNIVGTKVYE